MGFFGGPLMKKSLTGSLRVWTVKTFRKPSLVSGACVRPYIFAGMTDRLRDLKRGGQTSISIDGSREDANVSSTGKASLLQNDVHSANAAAGSGSSSADVSSQFFADLDSLKKEINKIKEASARVSDLTQETILATSNEKESELSAEINPLIAETNKKGMFSKKLLQALKEQATKIESEQVRGRGRACVCKWCM